MVFGTGVGLAVAGGLRIELGSVIAGSVLALLVLVSWVLTAISWARSLRLRLRSIHIDRTTTAGGSASGEARLSEGHRRTAGVVCALRVQLRFRDNEVHERIVIESSHIGFRVGFPRHGVYHGEGVLEMRNALGLAHASRDLGPVGPVVVRPLPLHAPLTGFLGREGGRRLVVPHALRRSADLLEARHYQPGDDPRRINWNAYARTGELLLRIGERSIPPTERITVFVDFSPPGRRAGVAYLEDYLRLVSGLLYGVVANGQSIEIRSVASGETIDINAEDSSVLSEWLAARWWWDTVPTPRGGSLRGLVAISHPLSPLLVDLRSGAAGLRRLVVAASPMIAVSDHAIARAFLRPVHPGVDSRSRRAAQAACTAIRRAKSGGEVRVDLV